MTKSTFFLDVLFYTSLLLNIFACLTLLRHKYQAYCKKIIYPLMVTVALYGIAVLLYGIFNPETIPEHLTPQELFTLHLGFDHTTQLFIQLAWVLLAIIPLTVSIIQALRQNENLSDENDRLTSENEETHQANSRLIGKRKKAKEKTTEIAKERDRLAAGYTYIISSPDVPPKVRDEFLKRVKDK
ncbi:hypothetical protein [Bacteroides sp. Phil13]|uniref:hypothetical protein n=1 Tax=Bacteroides sp. Phil13 TaxID=1929999 RepID=UPI00257E0E76|nr:hypothetical protein [Bacteroides sp. Phil13]